MRPQKGQRRKTPMVETFTLKVRQVEFVGDQSRCNMRGELRMAFDRRKPSSAASVIRTRVRFTETESEVRVVFEKERRDVIVIDQEQNVGSCFSEPFADRLIALKNGCPIRIGFLLRVMCETDGWCGRWRLHRLSQP